MWHHVSKPEVVEQSFWQIIHLVSTIIAQCVFHHLVFVCLSRVPRVLLWVCAHGTGAAGCGAVSCGGLRGVPPLPQDSVAPCTVSNAKQKQKHRKSLSISTAQQDLNHLFFIEQAKQHIYTHATTLTNIHAGTHSWAYIYRYLYILHKQTHTYF